MMDLCGLVHGLRSHFFAKDRDVVLQTSRVFEGPGMLPVGAIIIWSGAIGDIPTGWQICDGTNGTPNLRDRFVVGAGSTYAVDATGGSATVDLRHRHASGTYDTDSDVHNHGVGSMTVGTPSATNTNIYNAGTEDAQGDHIHTLSGSTASDTHDHDVTGNSEYARLTTTEENRPPYYALAFIQRLT